MHILRGELLRQRGRPDKIAEHHAQQTPVGCRLSLNLDNLGARSIASARNSSGSIEAILHQAIDRSEDNLPVTEGDAEFLEVGLCDMRKRPKIDVIADERLGIFAESELAQPILDRLHR